MTVVHSTYWRSSHWSHEFEYFFEIAPNAKLKEQLFAENKLRQVTGEEATRTKEDVFGRPPSWFAPKDVAEYDAWILEPAAGGHFKVLIHRGSGAMYLHDFQI